MSKSWTSPPHAVNLRQFFSNIYNLRLLRNFPVTSRRWSCSRYRKIFPAWKNVKYQYGQGAKCFGTNRGIFHSQACTFPQESFILSSSCNSVCNLLPEKPSQCLPMSLAGRETIPLPAFATCWQRTISQIARSLLAETFWVIFSQETYSLTVLLGLAGFVDDK